MGKVRIVSVLFHYSNQSELRVCPTVVSKPEKKLVRHEIIRPFRYYFGNTKYAKCVVADSFS